MVEAVFTICLLLSLGNAFCIGRKAERTDFLLAGRTAGAVTVGASLLATCLGGSAVIGMVGRAYIIGISAFWWLGAGALGLVLLAFFYVPHFQRDADCATLPDWIGIRAGIVAQRFAGLLIVVMWIGVVAAQWVAAATVVSRVTHLEYLTSLAGVAVLTTAYTAIGGQAVVLKTDKIQTLFIFVAVAVPALLMLLRPLPPLADALPPATGTAPVQAWQWLALFVTVGGMYVVGPDMFSRIRTAASERSARRGALLAAGGVALAGFLLAFLGATAQGRLPFDIPSRDVLPFLIDRQLPPIAAAALHAGVLAALLSSADTCLLTAASVASRNLGLPGPGGTARVRLLLCLIAMVAATVAGINPLIIGNIMIAYAAFAGGLLVPLLALPFLARHRERLAWPMATAMIGGATAAVVAFILGFGMHPDFALRLAATGLAGALVSAAILFGMLKVFRTP